jgi:hypothetical protein
VTRLPALRAQQVRAILLLDELVREALCWK